MAVAIGLKSKTHRFQFVRYVKKNSAAAAATALQAEIAALKDQNDALRSEIFALKRELTGWQHRNTDFRQT